MSDEAGKTRRNLVVLSSAVVAIAFLEVPLQGSLIGAINLDKVDPKSAWIAVAVCQAYFFVRFLTDGNNTKNIKLWWGQVRDRQPAVVRSFLLSKKSNRDFTTWKYEVSKPDDVADARIDLYEIHDRIWTYERGTRIATAHALWREYQTINGRATLMRDITPLFKVSRQIPLKLFIKSYVAAIWKAAIPGWVFTEYVFPTGWAIASFSICLYKAATAPEALFRLLNLCT